MDRIITLSREEITATPKTEPAQVELSEVEFFDSLKCGQEIEIKITACMAGHTKPVRMWVGRRSRSKKYGVDTVTLLPSKGAKPRKYARTTLNKRKGQITAGMGDMGAMFSDYKIIG